MIAILLAMQVLGASAETTVVYAGVPAEVVRIQAFEWLGARPGAVTTADRHRDHVVVRGRPQRVYVVVFARADGAYLLDGPFPWPAEGSRRAVPADWHRTLSGMVADEGAIAGGLEWFGASERRGPWPLCFRAARRWSCWGVRPADAGVVVSATPSGIHWSVVIAGVSGPMRQAAWGRLIVVTDAMGAAEKVTVKLARPVAAPPARLSGVRLATAAVAGGRALVLAPNVCWVVADEAPPRAWAEIGTKTGGPVYLALEEVAGASASVPLHVALPERRRIAGRALGQAGESAPGTLVATFRLIDPPRVDGARELPRRVLASETIADAEGRFEIADLGQADYEIVAWHPQLGRVSMPVPAAAEVVVRLRGAGIARGRILAGGQPVAGVDVISVPDALTFTSAPDITAVKGGDTQSGADGRFSVIVADSGGGELRVGGGKYAVKRVPLPRPPLPIFDVGDVDLGASLALTVVLDHDPHCSVRAVGPVGRTGLHVVDGNRTAEASYGFTLPEPGLWEFTLACVGEQRALSPGVVEIGSAHEGRELRFVVK